MRKAHRYCYCMSEWPSTVRRQSKPIRPTGHQKLQKILDFLIKSAEELCGGGGSALRHRFDSSVTRKLNLISETTTGNGESVAAFCATMFSSGLAVARGNLDAQ